MRVKANSARTNEAFLVSVQQFFDQEKIELYESITPQLMREYIQFRRDCGISDVTINNSIQVLQSVCKFVKENNLAPQNPLENFKKIRVDKQDDVRILSKKDLATIEEIAQSSSRRDEFFFLVRTGCRLSEMINLEVGDIDLKKNRVKISASKAKSRRTRYVPITKSVVEILQRKVKAANERGCTIVFPNNRGKKLFAVSVWKSFSCILQKAKEKGVNVDGVKVHTLRATYISHMIMNGVDPMKVMRIVGHTNFETMKKYLHLSDEYLNDVPEIF